MCEHSNHQFPADLDDIWCYVNSDRLINTSKSDSRIFSEISVLFDYFFPCTIEAFENDQKKCSCSRAMLNWACQKTLWILQETTNEIKSEYSFRNYLCKCFLLKQWDVSSSFFSVSLKFHVLEGNMSRIQGFIF